MANLKYGVLGKVQTYNSTHFAKLRPSHPKTFHPFNRLPTELRLRIWELSILRTRLVTAIVLRGTEGTGNATGGYRRTNHLGNIISGDHYVLKVSQKRRNDALLGTCRESRHVAIGFFRVRIPLQPGRPYGARLYFNPEYDYLYIYSSKVAAESLIGLLHDLRAFDPKGKGLLHFVSQHLRLSNEAEEPFPLSQDALSPAQVCSFRRSLLSIETLWFVNHWTNFLNERCIFQRSIPFMARAGTFEIMDCDPRGGRGNKSLAMGLLLRKPHVMRRKWEHWEKELGFGTLINGDVAKPSRQISYVLANLDNDHMEEPAIEPCGIPENDETGIDDFDGHRDPLGQIQPAVGFWVVSQDEVDELTSETHERTRPPGSALDRDSMAFGVFDI